MYFILSLLIINSTYLVFEDFYVFFVSVFICFIRIFHLEKQALYLGLLFGILTGFYAHSFWGPESLPFPSLESRFGHVYSYSIMLGSFGVMIAVLLQYLIFRLVKTISSKTTSQILFAIIFSAFVALSISSIFFYTSPPPPLQFFSVLIFSRSFNYLLAYIAEGHEKYGIEAIPPFWDLSISPRPNLILNVEPDRKALDRDAFFLSGKFFAAKLFLFLFFRIFWEKSLFSHSVSPRQMRFQGFRSLVWNIDFHFLNRTEIVSTYFLNVFFFIALLLSFGYVFDVFYLLLGYRVTRHFRLPLKAKSFAEFYSAIMPYYTEYAFKVYFLPIYSIIRKKMKDKKAAAEISLWLAILLCGIVMHFFFEAGVLVLDPTRTLIFKLILNWSFYFSLIYVLIKCLRFDRINSFAMRSLVLTIFIFIFGVILLFSFDVLYVDMQTRFRVVEQIFFNF